MLLEIHIKDYSIMDNLNIEFKSGLNILTGETGAGKSIIIDALGVVLGTPIAKNIIRKGCKRTEISCLFRLNEDISLRRVVDKDEGSKCWINGSPVLIKELKTIGDRLVEMHGRHSHQSLLKVERQQELLDEFSRAILLRNKLEKLFLDYTKKKRELENEEKRIKELKEKEEFYSFQVKSIEDAHLKANEDDEILARIKIMENSERLKELVEGAYMELYESDNSVAEKIERVKKALKEAGEIDKKLGETSKTIEELGYSIEAIAADLRPYKESISYDKEELEKLRMRYFSIQEIKQKFNKSIPQILSYKEQSKRALETLDIGEEKIDSGQKELLKIRNAMEKAARELTEKRKNGANILEKRVEQELKTLGMPNASFFVKFTEIEIGKNGKDSIEFMFSANPGESPAPLRKIASGGELSRVTLALKSILAEADKIPVLVFDEIDLGTSGRIAEKIGEKLEELSKMHQVICITHLPQIASRAANHIRVWKEIKDGRTVTRIAPLSYEQRIKEVAKLIGGKKVMETALKHAEKMVKR
jgi:DNA repair protein RecN (Recombination protein N)